VAKRKMTKGKTMIYKTLHRKLKTEQQQPHTKLCDFRVKSSCSTCGARRGSLATNHVISDQWEKVVIVIVITTNGRYPRSLADTDVPVNCW